MYAVIFKATTKELDEENNIRNKMKINLLLTKRLSATI